MTTRDTAGPAQFVRVASARSAGFEITVDGAPVAVSEGQSLLAAILLTRRAIRHSDAAGEPRAGFCLMGVCQDCWVWLEDGRRLRACTTRAETGMQVSTGAPPGWPLLPGEGTP